VPARKCRYQAVRSAYNPGNGDSGAEPHTDYVDRVPVKRSYKFRAYPTRTQEARAVRLLADHCDLYNAALMERREAWQTRRVSVSYGTQSAQLT
jgi:hypothetical protein